MSGSYLFLSLDFRGPMPESGARLPVSYPRLTRALVCVAADERSCTRARVSEHVRTQVSVHMYVPAHSHGYVYVCEGAPLESP